MSYVPVEHQAIGVHGGRADVGGEEDEVLLVHRADAIIHLLTRVLTV